MKFTVTEVLVSYIKEKRKERKITVTAFANKIGKSKSYITKFDNCEFKTLTVDVFNKIFEAISDSKEQAIEFMDEYFSTLESNDYTKKNIDLMIDFSNYSNIVKEIDIPTDLITYINNLLTIDELDIQEIIDKANMNSPVKNYPNYDIVDFNEYVSTPVTVDTNAETENCVYIKIKLNKDDISPILNKEITKCNYFTLLAFTNAYFQIDFSKSAKDIDSDELYKTAAISAHNLLFNFKFYTLKDNRTAKKNEENLSILIKKLRGSSNSVQGTLGSYMYLITQIYKQDLYYTERKISGLRRNMENDPAFLIATMDLPFYKLKNLSIDNKKKLLKDIIDLINKSTEDEASKDQLDLI